MKNQITKIDDLKEEQKKLLLRTVARGATMDEFALFLSVARRAGLDPFTKQIHFVKRRVWNNGLNDGKGGYEEVGSIQTGIDGYRAIAERSQELAGIEDPVFDDESQPNPKKSTVTVWRMVAGAPRPFQASARWSEYAQMRKDKGTGEMVPMGQWAKMPYHMLGKCAEALALRKAFPNDLSGLYTNEEMDQADADPKTKVIADIAVEEKNDKKNEMAAMLNKPVKEEKIEEVPITEEEVKELEKEYSSKETT